MPRKTSKKKPAAVLSSVPKELVDQLFSGLMSAEAVNAAASPIPSLPITHCFHIIGNMENSEAIAALAALAQDSRLAVFRLLVRHAPDGLTAGVIGERLDLPAPTLSFHLKTLAQAGLVGTAQEGRFVRYRAKLDGIDALVAFLTEDCCGGHPELCSPKDRQ